MLLPFNYKYPGSDANISITNTKSPAFLRDFKTDAPVLGAQGNCSLHILSFDKLEGGRFLGGFAENQ